jgi:hypothetical protein
MAMLQKGKKERNGKRERGRKRGAVVFTIIPTVSM